MAVDVSIEQVLANRGFASALLFDIDDLVAASGEECRRDNWPCDETSGCR
jgi:hypothetical protein